MIIFGRTTRILTLLTKIKNTIEEIHSYSGSLAAYIKLYSGSAKQGYRPYN
jgi:hypothetical protein